MVFSDRIFDIKRILILYYINKNCIVSLFSDITCDPANAFDLSAFCLIRLFDSFILSSNVIVLHPWETLHCLSAVDLSAHVHHLPDLHYIPF